MPPLISPPEPSAATPAAAEPVLRTLGVLR